MYYKTVKTPFAALIGAGICLLPACQDSTVESPNVPSDGASVTLKLTKFGSTTESTGSVDLLQFSGGVLRQKISATADQSDPVTFNRGDDNRIYAVSGWTLDVVPDKTTEETIAKAVINLKEGETAPIFFSAIASLDSVASTMSLELQRGVARIDISNSDSLLTVKEVIVENVPTASYLFPVEGEKYADASTTTHSRTFDENIWGLERGVFTIFESTQGATVKISGEKEGEAVEIVAMTPAINRNKVYTVSLLPDDPFEGNTFTSKVTVADWEKDGDYNPGPGTHSGLTLDLEACNFPDNVKFDPATGFVEIPAEGIDNLQLAFRSDIRIDIDTILLTGNDVERDSLVNRAVTVKGYKVTESGNDIITTYNVKIMPQLICRSEYVADFGIRKASMVSVYDHVKLRVAEHPKQIKTVFIGGSEWMCFNATSSNLEEQIFPVDGLSVEEMYDQHYVDCVGNYFQYGKPNPFSPWTSNNPNEFAEQTRNIPWNSPEAMPLPEGYHVASAAEWKALMPNGITLPAAWMTASGDSIKGSVVTLPGTLETPSDATNARNFKMRYILFESVTTGNKLIVPLAGLKANNTAEVPGHGNLGFDLRTSYWLMDDRYTWLIDYKATENGEDGAVLKQDRWAYDGFVPMRGIKD